MFVVRMFFRFGLLYSIDWVRQYFLKLVFNLFEFTHDAGPKTTHCIVWFLAKALPCLWIRRAPRVLDLLPRAAKLHQMWPGGASRGSRSSARGARLIHLALPASARPRADPAS